MLGELNALGSALTWAFAGTCAKALVGRMNIVALSALRGVVASALVIPFIVAMGRGPQIFDMPLPNLLFLVGANSVFLVADLAFLLALKRGDISRIFPVSVGFYIFSSVVVSTFITGESTGWSVAGGAVLITLGVVLASSSTASRWWSREHLLTASFGMALLAGGLWTSGAFLLNTGLEGVDPLASFAVRILATSVILLPFLFLGRWFRDGRQRSSTLGILVLFALFFALSSFMYQEALSHTSVAVAVSLVSTSSVFALPLGVVIGERLSRRNIYGVGMALSGIWLLVLV